MAIMPPLFIYAIASEQKLTHKMNEMASESLHAREVSQWAEEQRTGTDLVSDAIKDSRASSSSDAGSEQQQLLALYRKSVEESGVRIVKGDTLQPYHHLANFWQANPVRYVCSYLGYLS